jgi:thioredoxin-dependent peroxiredoxin
MTETSLKTLQTGDKAPVFTLASDGGNTVSLAALQGKNIVLYFYPKDDTPGCTTESKAFSDALAEFEKLNTQVIGLSKDSVKSHDNFKEKHCLTIPLVSDEDGKTCEAYGTWIEKSMYGKKYMGIDRATFLINKEGTIEHIWRKVSVTNHVNEVLQAVKGLEAR